jgi:hypothetical protein
MAAENKGKEPKEILIVRSLWADLTFGFGTQREVQIRRLRTVFSG